MTIQLTNINFCGNGIPDLPGRENKILTGQYFSLKSSLPLRGILPLNYGVMKLREDIGRLSPESLPGLFKVPPQRPPRLNLPPSTSFTFGKDKTQEKEKPAEKEIPPKEWKLPPQPRGYIKCSPHEFF